MSELEQAAQEMYENVCLAAEKAGVGDPRPAVHGPHVDPMARKATAYVTASLGIQVVPPASDLPIDVLVQSETSVSERADTYAKALDIVRNLRDLITEDRHQVSEQQLTAPESAPTERPLRVNVDDPAGRYSVTVLVGERSLSIEGKTTPIPFKVRRGAGTVMVPVSGDVSVAIPAEALDPEPLATSILHRVGAAVESVARDDP